MKFSRLKTLLFLHLSHLPMPSTKWRPLFAKWGGVNVVDYKHCFIGENVVFDTNYPQDITIEAGVRVTAGGVLVTHFFHPDTNTYSRGKIHIKRNAYLGVGVLVVKPVTIGENACVGAGSVVTKDIPDNELWAGSPARFIRKLKP